MRIIGGQFKGRKFYPPAKHWPTRPTTDFAKEGLFNILQNRIDFESTKMLDLFGGTGNQCYEAISRGCLDVTYVDKFREAVKFVKQVSEELDILDEIHILQMDVLRFIKLNKIQYDYIFAGPPYPLKWLDQIPDMIFKYGLLAEDGLFVLEHNPNHSFKDHEGYVEERNYSQTIFSFFRHKTGTVDSR